MPRLTAEPLRDDRNYARYYVNQGWPWTAHGFEDGGPFYGYFGTYNYNYDSTQSVPRAFTTSLASCYGVMLEQGHDSRRKATKTRVADFWCVVFVREAGPATEWCSLHPESLGRDGASQIVQATFLTSARWYPPPLIVTGRRGEFASGSWLVVIGSVGLHESPPDGVTLRGVRTLVPLVRLPALLAGPGPSGSAGPSRRCRGCFPPSPTSLGSGCPQLRHAAATAQRRRSSTPARLHSASWRTRSPSQSPGTARSSTSFGRSLMLIMLGMRFLRCPGARLGWRSARPVRRHFASSRRSAPRDWT